jgi:transcriptional regulator with XRE-family HTH domain
VVKKADDVAQQMTSTVTDAKPKKATQYPVTYSAYLARKAEEAGLDTHALEAATGLSYQTVYRALSGQPQRAAKSAIAIRDVLLQRGVDVLPVPVGYDSWTEPKLRPAQVAVAEGEEVLRRNLVRFREQAGYPDLHEGARATGISFEMLRAYEVGEREISGSHLLELARVYERNPSEFELANPPPGKKPAPAIYFRVVGDMDEMSRENRDRVVELQKELAELNEDERRRRSDAASKPKRR